MLNDEHEATTRAIFALTGWTEPQGSQGGIHHLCPRSGACASKSVLNQAISPVRVQIADRVWFVFALDSAQGPLNVKTSSSQTPILSMRVVKRSSPRSPRKWGSYLR
jgi:hypothetical protein